MQGLARGIFARCRGSFGRRLSRAMRGAEAAEPRKKAIRRYDVASNLRAQFFRPAELLLRAQTLPESHFNPFRRRLSGIVQKMRFDREAGAVERWPHPDVRDRAIALHLAIKLRTRNVH